LKELKRFNSVVVSCFGDMSTKRRQRRTCLEFKTIL